MLELLAPAGSPESVIAAVQSGADAIYLGYGDFNARRNASRTKNAAHGQSHKTIPFNAGSYQASTAAPKAPYNHRCTICGRTDISHPDLEFRYCSRCNGYYCYCEDHISNHTHIQ